MKPFIPSNIRSFILRTGIATASAIGLSLGGSSIATAATFSGFSGAFAPGQWTLTNTNVDPTPNLSGAVDTTNAPSSITLYGGDDGTNLDPIIGFTDFKIVSPVAGTWKFDWSFFSLDGDSGLDKAGYVINNVFTEVVAWDANSTGSIDSTSPVSFNVNVGDTVGFRAVTLNNVGGAGEFTVSNFTVETSDVPFEFSPTLGLGIIGAGIGYRRWQRRRAG